MLNKLSEEGWGKYQILRTTKNIEPVVPGRGFQVKQKVRCVLHKESFVGIPSLMLSGKYFWGCYKCGVDRIDSGYWLQLKPKDQPQLFTYLLKTKPRHKHHTFVSLTDKGYKYFCERAKSYVLETTPRVEVSGNQNQSACAYCSKLAKIQKTNHALNTKNCNTEIKVDLSGNKVLVCKLHNIPKVGSRCLLCKPLVYDPKAKVTEKLNIKLDREVSLADLNLQLRKEAAKRLGLPFRVRNNRPEILICKTHKTIVECPYPKKDNTFKVRCDKCFLKKARAALLQRFPNLRAPIKVTGHPTVVKVVVKGVDYDFSIVTKKFRSKIPKLDTKFITYIKKRYHIYGC